MDGPADADESAEAAGQLHLERDARAREDTDQGAADLDQTHADRDQTLSDDDQGGSDDDRDQAQRDQHAADRDQAAADYESENTSRDTAAGRAHEASRKDREKTAQERVATAAARVRTGEERLATARDRDDVARVRDRTAAARDEAALARDRAAEARDQAAEAREKAAESRAREALTGGAPESAVAPLRELRRAAVAARQRSAQARLAAAIDRRAAAADRERAAKDREDAALDDLTGVFRRGMGELALTHEVERSRRTGRCTALVIIDVDALKAVNDAGGHAAGDALLRDVATAITSTVRAYDVAVRWGGDEFVCALYDVSLEVAAARVEAIQRALEARSPGATISAGLVLTRGLDTLADLLSRADEALYAAKRDPERRIRIADV